MLLIDVLEAVGNPPRNKDVGTRAQFVHYTTDFEKIIAQTCWRPSLIPVQFWATWVVLLSWPRLPEDDGERHYRFEAEAFSDSLCGAFFCKTLTRWRPDAGTAILFPSTISRAVTLRP